MDDKMELRGRIGLVHQRNIWEKKQHKVIEDIIYKLVCWIQTFKKVANKAQEEKKKSKEPDDGNIIANARNEKGK